MHTGEQLGGLFVSNEAEEAVGGLELWHCVWLTNQQI